MGGLRRVFSSVSFLLLCAVFELPTRCNATELPLCSSKSYPLSGAIPTGSDKYYTCDAKWEAGGDQGGPRWPYSATNPTGCSRDNQPTAGATWWNPYNTDHGTSTVCWSGCVLCANIICLYESCATDCNSGHFKNKDSQTCEACPIGTSNQARNLQPSCTSCSRGYYASDTGSTACSQCSPGKYSDETKLAECKGCSEGKFATNQASHSCTACPSGLFAAGANNAQCEPCTAGRYQTTTGQTSCVECGVGKYATCLLYTSDAADE